MIRYRNLYTMHIHEGISVKAVRALVRDIYEQGSRLKTEKEISSMVLAALQNAQNCTVSITARCSVYTMMKEISRTYLRVEMTMINVVIACVAMNTIDITLVTAGSVRKGTNMS